MKKTKAQKPQLISEVVAGNMNYDLDGNLDDAISYLRYLKNQYNEKYSDLKIRYYFDFQCEQHQMKLYGSRLETQQELEARLSLDEVLKQDTVKQKLARLIDLKKEMQAIESSLPVDKT